MSGTEPPLSTVIIGINTEKTISKCIQSVKDSHYPQGKIEIIYVDGGSDDDSVALARQFKGVKIVELKQKRPTPGRGRNAGWQHASYDKILFLDGDTVLDPSWVGKAISKLEGDFVAVCGRREEEDRHKNLFHLISNIEWDCTEGEIKAFGGDVMIKNSALSAVGGYDDELIGGEDPDLSFRIREKGGRLLRINELMTTHDANMHSFSQYWNRAVRTGYAYAEVGLRYLDRDEKFWFKNFLRTILSVTVPIVIILIGFALGYGGIGVLLGLALAFRSLRLVNKFKEKFHLTYPQSFIYALHLSFVVIPQSIGAVKYLLSRFFETNHKS